MTRLNAWRKAHPLAGDTIATIVIVAAVAGIGRLRGQTDELLAVLNGSRSASYSAVASISGSLLGFVITSVSIIAAFGAMPKFEILRKSPQYAAIFGIFFDSIYWLASTTILALFGLVFDTDRAPMAILTCAALLVFSITAARVWRCVWILQKLAKVLAQPIPETQPFPQSGGQP